MAEIDLIPVDYRNWLQQQSVVRKYLTIILSLVTATVIIAMLLQHAVRRAEAAAAQLKSENAITQQQQNQLQQLQQQQAEFERQWSLLRGLRAGAAIDDIFVIIDRSLVPGELWFLEWGFRRAGVTVEGEQQGVETGYFIIVSEDARDYSEADLEVETHMTIHGQARDHQALSKFVRALFERRDIKDVNVRKTSRADYGTGRVVDFDMTLVLNSVFKDS